MLQLATGVSLVVSASKMFILMLIVNAMLMALTGAYLAILYPYIYINMPVGLSTAKITEKALFVILPMFSTCMLTWAAISNFGLHAGPYWFLLLQIVSYFLFGLPQSSSYAKLSSQSKTSFDPDVDTRVVTGSSIYAASSSSFASEDAASNASRATEMVGGVRHCDLICNELLSYFQTLQLFLPLGLHCATYWRSILLVIPNTVGEWTHFADICILTLIPVLLIGLMGTVMRYSPLWWAKNLGGGRFQDQASLCKLFVLLATFILIPCLEFRVLFSAFDHLLTGMSRPWNYVSLTLALYAFVLSITIHLRTGAKASGGAGFFSASGNFSIAPSSSTSFSGASNTGASSASTNFQALLATQMSQARRVSYFLAIFCALMISLALGVPIYLWPATLLSAIAFISFYFERRWWMYAAFVVGLLFGLAWFCFKTFFSLQFTFFTLAGFVSIQIASVWILVLAAIAASVTGLILLGLASKWANSLLIAQAALIATLEEILHMEQMGNQVEIYPAYLVVLTTVLGVLMAQKLKKEGLLNTNVLFVVSMIYLSKLALLLKPVSWPTISAMLLLTPPLYLVLKLWDAQNVLNDVSKSNTICIVYTVWMFVATLFNRWTLFQRILEILAGEIQDHASPALVHGLSFVFFGALLPPLAWHHPYRSESAMSNEFSTKRRRIISFSGFALIAIGFTAMSSQQIFGSSPSRQILGASVMSSMLGMRTGLPLISTFALLALVLIIALILTGTINITQSLRQRLVAAQALGLALGAFISPFAMSTNLTGLHANEDDATPLFIVFGVCIIFQLAATIIACADWHTAAPNAKWISWIPRLGPAAYTWMWLQWPLLFLGALVVTMITDEWRRDELESYNVALIAVQAFAQGIVALFLKMIEPDSNRPIPNPSMRGFWVPDIANVATLGCFLLSSAALLFSGIGSASGLVVLSPIMLLAQKAGMLEKFMPPKRRVTLRSEGAGAAQISTEKESHFFLVYVAASASLLFAAQLKLWLHGPLSAITQLVALTLPIESVTMEIYSYSALFEEVAAHLAIIPPSIAIAYYLWSLEPPSIPFMVFLSWLSTVPIYLSEIDALGTLGYLNTLLCVSIALYNWIMATPERSRPLNSAIIRDQ